RPRRETRLAPRAPKFRLAPRRLPHGHSRGLAVRRDRWSSVYSLRLPPCATKPQFVECGSLAPAFLTARFAWKEKRQLRCRAPKARPSLAAPYSAAAPTES